MTECVTIESSERGVAPWLLVIEGAARDEWADALEDLIDDSDRPPVELKEVQRCTVVLPR